MAMALTKWDQVKHDVAEARSIDDLRTIRDKAEALRQYAKRQKESIDVQNQIAEITLRCTRRMGEMLQEMPKNEGVRMDGVRRLHDATTVKLEDIGITKSESSRCQAIASLPEEAFEHHIEVVKGKHEELTKMGCVKLAQQVQRQQKEQQREQTYEQTTVSLDNYRAYHCAAAALRNQIEPCSVDVIITDPPYPYEYLSTYVDLSEFADYALKPGGSLLALAGQSYLPQVMQCLQSSLEYHWTLAYLTPGGQSAQLWQRKVNTFWKPLLWFTKGAYTGNWVGDVCKSNVNDNDKNHHHWGQSESGIADIIERFSLPGQIICDPFVGGGTTAVVAAGMKRYFVGCDIDAACVEKTNQRLREVLS